MKEIKIDYRMFRFESEEMATDVLIKLRQIAKEKGRAMLTDFLDIYLSVMPCGELYKKAFTYDLTLFEFGWTFKQLMNVIPFYSYIGDEQNRVYYYMTLPTPMFFEDVDKGKETEEEQIDLEKIACDVYTDMYDLEDLPYMVEDMVKEIEKELIYRNYKRSKCEKIVVINHEKISKKIESMEKDIVYTAYKTILEKLEED